MGLTLDSTALNGNKINLRYLVSKLSDPMKLNEESYIKRATIHIMSLLGGTIFPDSSFNFFFSFFFVISSKPKKIEKISSTYLGKCYYCFVLQELIKSIKTRCFIYPRTHAMATIMGLGENRSFCPQHLLEITKSFKRLLVQGMSITQNRLTL